MNIRDEDIEKLLDVLDESAVAEVTYMKEDGSFGQAVLHEGKTQTPQQALMLLGAMQMNQNNIMRVLRNSTAGKSTDNMTMMENN